MSKRKQRMALRKLVKSPTRMKISLVPRRVDAPAQEEWTPLPGPAPVWEFRGRGDSTDEECHGYTTIKTSGRTNKE